MNSQPGIEKTEGLSTSTIRSIGDSVKALTLAGVILLGLGIWINYGATNSPFVAGIFVSVAVMLFTFSIALTFVDPLSQKVIEHQQRIRWRKTGVKSLGIAEKSIRTAIANLLIPLYGVPHAKLDLEDEHPAVGELLHSDVQGDPRAFLDLAARQMEFVKAFLDTDKEDGSTEHAAAIGRFLLAEDTSVCSRLRDIDERLRIAWDFYSAIPYPEPDALAAIIDARDKIADLLALCRSSDALARSLGTKNEDWAYGFFAVAARYVCERLLVAYSFVGGLKLRFEHEVADEMMPQPDARSNNHDGA